MQMMARRRCSLVIALALFARCSSDEPGLPEPPVGVPDGSPAEAASPYDAGVPDTTEASVPDAALSDATDGAAPEAAMVDRGPTRLPLDGDPAGLYWDYGTGGGLYVADRKQSRIVKWTDATGFVLAANLPGSADGGSDLGQIVRLLDGTMIVTRQGAGIQGGVFMVDATGDAGAVSAPDAGLKANRQRVGLTFLPDNTLIDTYFVETDAGSTGALATLKLTASEKDLLTGLSRPVGVVHSEGNLYVSDQALGAILKIGKAGGVYVSGDGGSAEAGGTDAAATDSGSSEAGIADAAATDSGDTEAGSTDAAATDAGDAEAGGTDAAAVARAVVFAKVDRPGYLCQGPDGSIFVASLAGSVLQISRAGVVSVAASGLTEPRGVAFDGAARRLFVADHDPAAGAQQSIRIYPIP
jgi:hypothetical protein